MTLVTETSSMAWEIDIYIYIKHKRNRYDNPDIELKI